MPIIVMIVSGLAFWTLYWFVQMDGIEHFQQRRKQREDDAKRAAAREASRLAPLRAVDEMLEEVARNELPYEREIEAITAFRPKIGLAAAA
jgi:Tfp pilus assembly protein PilO